MSQQKSLLRWMAYSAFANALLSFSSFAIYMFMSNVWLYSALESERFHNPESIPRTVFGILYCNYYGLFLLLESIKFFLCLSQGVLIYGFCKWFVFPSRFLPLVSLTAGIISIIFLFMAGLIALTYDPAWKPPQHPDFFYSVSRVHVSKIITQFSMISISAMGFWHLVVNLQAFMNRQLPTALAVIGTLLGTASLFAYPYPPLALLVLALSLVWMIWLGVILLNLEK